MNNTSAFSARPSADLVLHAVLVALVKLPGAAVEDPKGAGPRTFSQADLDDIAHELDHRPCKAHGLAS
nr:hypothetical protein [Streptomyces acidicola]